MNRIRKFLQWLIEDECDRVNRKRQEQGKPPIIFW